MKLISIFTISFLLVCSQAIAQSTVKGKVMELHTDVLLSGITIENQTQKLTTHTDDKGNFTIKAKKGDLLCFSGLNYLADTIYLTDTKNMLVKLELRSNQLKEVQVTQQGLNNNGSFAAPAEKGILGSKTVFYKEGGGMKIKLFDSHSNEKKRLKLEQLDLNGQREQAIAQVFSATNLKNYIPLTGQEMSNFIIKYTPTVAMYYARGFNLTSYINDSYKDFLTIPEDKRKSKTYFQLNGDGGN